MSTDPADAALDAVDHDRLLPGEDVESPHADDVAHWLAVYSELCTFKDALLDATLRQASEMKGDALEEVEKTDLPVLRAEAERLRRRLRFWSERATRLATEGGQA